MLAQPLIVKYGRAMILLTDKMEGIHIVTQYRGDSTSRFEPLTSELAMISSLLNPEGLKTAAVILKHMITADRSKRY